MITIKKQYVTVKDGKARLSADVEVDGKSSVLWFEVEEKYARFLCPERSDAFVLAFVQFALQKGHHITAEVPLTERLHQRLTEGFLPAFNRLNGFDLRITAPVAPEVEHPEDGNHVGAGCSCGVDSMHIYACHEDITDACVWNMHGVDTAASTADRARAFEDLVARARQFQAEVKMPNLIVADTNFDGGCIGGLCFDGMISYGNLFMVFAMQKYWAKFYVAGGLAIEECSMKAKSVWESPAHYEFFLFPFLTLKQLMIELDGAAANRFEKVKKLAGYPAARKFLNVCHRINEGHKNGSYDCPKCMRTMLELYCANALDNFGEVFDVAYFHSHKHEYLAEYWRGLLNKDPFALELRPYMGGGVFLDVGQGARFEDCA